MSWMSINDDPTPSTPWLAAVSHVAQNQTAFFFLNKSFDFSPSRCTPLCYIVFPITPLSKRSGIFFLRRFRLFREACASMCSSALCSAVTDNSFPTADWFSRPLSRKPKHRYLCSPFPSKRSGTWRGFIAQFIAWNCRCLKKTTKLPINDSAFYLHNDWSMLTSMDCTFPNREQK